MIEEREYEKLKKKIDGMGEFQAFNWDEYIITKGGAIEKKSAPRKFPHWIHKIKKFDADLEGYDYELLNVRDCEHNEGGRVCVRIIKQSEESIPNLMALNHTVFIGDCLDAMREMEPASIDLIATDPPFNKEKRFDHNFGSPKGYKPGFDDKWDGWLMTPQRAEELTLLEKCHPKLHRLCAAALEMHSAGMQGYLVMMAVRLIECHRLLKETGSIYLHCDHSANAYLRLLMDGIFGEKNFRREICWQMKSVSGYKSKTQNWIRDHDTILYYVKNAGMQIFNKQFSPYREEYVKKMFTKTDEHGRRYRQRANRRYYADEGKVPSGDCWTDIHSLQTITQSKQITGWRTQKPLALYSRMILASSNPGDVVLDPFCGCATTLVAAENAGRQWIGIDRDECAGEMVVQQLTKLNEGTEDWLRKVIVRDDIPERTDAGKIPHYSKHKTYLYEKQHGKCAGCGYPKESFALEIDHDIPRSKGGTDHISNLQLLCSRCNRRKGTDRLKHLRAKLRKEGLLYEQRNDF